MLDHNIPDIITEHLVEHFNEEEPLLSRYYGHQLPKTPLLHESFPCTPLLPAAFPETPSLPSSSDCDDEEFAEFVHCPHPEIESKLTEAIKSIKAEKTELAIDFSDFINFDYYLHVAIVLGIQLFIPIPYTVPMSIGFAKRAIKVFLPGFILGLAGHTAAQILSAAQHSKPITPASFAHLERHLFDLNTILTTFFTHLKIGALGGFILGIILTFVLNFVIMGHTVCRLYRGLNPEPSGLRRIMNSSKGYQCIQRFSLDLFTAVAQVPIGLAVRQWYYTHFTSTAAPTLSISSWHAAMVGAVGACTIQALLWVQYTMSLPKAPASPKEKERDIVIPPGTDLMEL